MNLTTREDEGGPFSPELIRSCETRGLTPANCHEVADIIGEIFEVPADNIGILRSLQATHLTFVYPQELALMGTIPLQAAEECAACQTVLRREAAIMNEFAQVRHMDFFETVEVGSAARGQSAPAKDARIIQKMMTAPVSAPGGEVLGVIQVCRKGPTREAAGRDFEPKDLEMLRIMAKALARSFC